MAEYIERTEELILAMNAGARAIENTKRYHGAVYTKDVFSDNSQEIPYLRAAKVLREVSDAPTADVAPVVHARWITRSDKGIVSMTHPYMCSRCWRVEMNKEPYCNCDAKMDGGVDNEN